MSKKIREALGAVGVHNDYEFFGREPYIWRRTKGGVRDVLPTCWVVTARGQDLKGDRSAWYQERSDHWVSDLDAPSGNWREAVVVAQQWAIKRFGWPKRQQFKRSPFGSYGRAEFVEARLYALLQTSTGKD